MSVKLGEAVVYLLGDAKGLQGELGAAEKQTTSWAQSLAGGVSKAIGGVMVAGVAAAGAAIAGLGVAAWKAGMTMDEAMDTLRVSTGKTGVELEALGQDFEAVFSQVPGEAVPAADAVAELNKRLGLTGEELQEVAVPLLRMTDMLGGDATTNTALLTRVMGDWGVASEDAAQTLDTLFVASQQTGAGVESLMQRVVQFGSPLRLMGFSLEESIAMFAKWEKEGVNAELVMGSLRIAAGHFAREGVQLQEGLRDTIAEIQHMDDASAALALGMEVFGARAGPDMVAAIREGRFEIDDLTAALEGSEGAILEAADATDDWPEKLARLRNQATVALAPIGGAMMDLAGVALDILGPALSGLAPVITRNVVPAIEALAGWLKDTLIPAIGPVTEAVGGLVKGLIWFITGGGDISSGMDGVIDAVVAIGEGFGLSRETIEGVLDAIWGFIDIASSAGSAAKEFILGIWEQIHSWALENWPLIQETVAVVLAAIQTAWETVWPYLSEFLNVTWGNIKLVVKTAIDAVLGIIKAVMQVITGDWEGAWETIKGVAEKLLGAIGQLIQSKLEMILGWFGIHRDQVQGTTSAMWETVRRTVEGAINFISAVISGALSAIRNWWQAHGESVMVIVGALWQWVQDEFVRARAGIEAIVQALVAAVTWLWETFGDEIVALAENAWTMVQKVVETAGEVLGGIVDAIAAAITGDWEAFGKALRDITDAIWDLVQTGFETAKKNLVLVVTGIVDAVKDTWQGIDWGAIGQSIIDGVARGISRGAGWVKEAMLSAARNAWDAVTGFFDAHSPSRRMAGLGQDLMEGMALGIQQRARVPTLAAIGASAGVVGAVTTHNYYLTAQYAHQSERTLAQDVRLLSMLTGG